MAAQCDTIDVDEHNLRAGISSVEVPNKSEDTGTTFPKKVCSHLYRHRGAVLVLLSASVFALWSAAAKIATQTLAPMQVVAMTSPFATVGSIALCVHSGVNLPKGRTCFVLLIVSSLMIAAKNIAHFFTFEYISLADIITIGQLSVVMIAIFSCIFLKERFGVLEAVFSVMAVLGVAVIARPSFIFGEVKDPLPNYNPLLGVLLTLIYALTAAIFVISARKVTLLGAHPYFNSVFNTAVSSAVTSLLCTVLGQWQCPTRSEWLLLSVVGVTYFVGQVLYYVALSIENATTVAVLFTFKIVAGFVWQFVFFSLLPTWTSVCGAGIVAVACIGTILHNSRKAASEGNTGEGVEVLDMEERTPSLTVAQDQGTETDRC